LQTFFSPGRRQGREGCCCDLGSRETTVLLEEAVSLFQNRQMWKPIGAMVMMVMMRRNFNLFLKFAKDLENVSPLKTKINK